jgi:hypothetical protein
MGTIQEQWEAGDLTTAEAMHRLLAAERAQEGVIQGAETQKRVLREQMAKIVAATGPFETPEWMVRWQDGIEYTSYRKDALNDLVQTLVCKGKGDIAAQILSCQEEKVRAGSLRVEPNRNANKKAV